MGFLTAAALATAIGAQTRTRPARRLRVGLTSAPGAGRPGARVFPPCPCRLDARSCACSVGSRTHLARRSTPAQSGCQIIHSSLRSIGEHIGGVECQLASTTDRSMQSRSPGRRCGDVRGGSKRVSLWGGAQGLDDDDAHARLGTSKSTTIQNSYWSSSVPIGKPNASVGPWYFARSATPAMRRLSRLGGAAVAAGRPGDSGSERPPGRGCAAAA